MVTPKIFKQTFKVKMKCPMFFPIYLFFSLLIQHVEAHLTEKRIIVSFIYYLNITYIVAWLKKVTITCNSGSFCLELVT